MSFQTVFKDNRKRLGYTQEDVATYLNVTPQAVSKWETGQGTPDFAMIVPIARLFNISTDELLGYEDMFLDSSLEEIYRSTEQTFREKYNKCLELLKNNPFNEDILQKTLSLSAEWLSSPKEKIDEQEKEELICNAKDFSKRLQKSQCGSAYGDAICKLADNYIAAGNFDQAKEEINKLPRSCRYTQNRMLGNLLLRKGQYERSKEYYKESVYDTVAFLLWDFERIAQCYGNMLSDSFKNNRSIIDEIYKIEYTIIHAMGETQHGLFKHHLCNATVRLAQRASWRGEREKAFGYLDEFIANARELIIGNDTDNTENSPVLPKDSHTAKSLDKRSVIYRLSWHAFDSIRNDQRFRNYLEEVNSWA